MRAREALFDGMKDIIAAPSEVRFFSGCTALASSTTSLDCSGLGCCLAGIVTGDCGGTFSDMAERRSMDVRRACFCQEWRVLGTDDVEPRGRFEYRTEIK